MPRSQMLNQCRLMLRGGLTGTALLGPWQVAWLRAYKLNIYCYMGSDGESQELTVQARDCLGGMAAGLKA